MEKDLGKKYVNDFLRSSSEYPLLDNEKRKEMIKVKLSKLEQAFEAGVEYIIKTLEKEFLTPLTDQIITINGFELLIDTIMENYYGEEYKEYYKNVDNKYHITIKKGISNVDENHYVIHVDSSDRCTISSSEVSSVGEFNYLMKSLNINFKILI
jgi:hypothetical protein